MTANIRKQKQAKHPHHPSDCKAGAPKKAIPLANNKHKQSVYIKNSLSLGGEMSQRDREGRLAINIDCPPTSPPISATAKQEPRKSRPPWGKEAGECLTEGGNSLSILDCFTTSPPNPTHHANKPHQIRGAIQYRKRAPPLRALTGPPLPKGRGLLYEPRKQNRTKPSFKQPIDLEVVVIVVVDCSIRGVGWRREFLLNHPLDFLKIQLAI